MKKVLVTGAMGFVGSHLCERMLADGYEVWGLDIAEPDYMEVLTNHKNFHHIVESVEKTSVLQTLVDQVDFVCHLAAIVDPGQSVKLPYKVMNITLKAAIDMVELLRFSGKPIFFTSTSEIYGKNPRVPWSEDDDRVIGSTSINRWCYTTSKSAVEHLIKACHEQKELDYLIVRLFNIYGPRMRGRVVNHFMDAALANSDIMVHGDGKQTRCYTYIDDCIEAFMRLIENRNAYNETYNVGTDVEHSVEDLARAVVKASDSKSQLNYIPHQEVYGESYEDISRRVPCVDRIEKAIDWKATTSLNQGLKSMVDYRRSRS